MGQVNDDREEAIEGELTRQNLSFLRPTHPGRNISSNKKYGALLFLSVVALD